MGYLVGVDAGGTSTRAVVLEADGTCLGYAKVGPGNPVSAGMDLARESLVGAVAEALARAGVPGERVEQVLISMAGGLTADQEESLAEPLRRLGVPVWPLIAGDQEGTFCSGTHLDNGYSLIAGTGAGATRWEGGRCVASSDGLGWLLGDEGSGFWIGHRVARAVFADMEGRGPKTALRPAFAAALGPLPRFAEAKGEVTNRAEGVRDAMRHLYTWRPVELAQFARLAFEAEGDPVADQIVARAARGLTATWLAVVSPQIPGPFVAGGGTIVHSPRLAGLVRSGLAEELGHEPDLTVVPDGTVGAAVLALRGAGVPVDLVTFNRVEATLAALRGH